MNEPITLKTLHLATHQQIFDQVARHLLTQKKKSLSDQFSRGGSSQICAYRGDEGRKCAAGVLIGDSEYDCSMEGMNFNRHLPLGYELQIPYNTIVFIQQLQDIHDTRQVGEWPERLKNKAIFHGLDISVLKEFGHE